MYATTVSIPPIQTRAQTSTIIALTTVLLESNPVDSQVSHTIISQGIKTSARATTPVVVHTRLTMSSTVTQHVWDSQHPP